MKRILPIALVLTAAATWAVCAAEDTTAAKAASEGTVRIGVVKSLFRDLSDASVQFLSRPLKALMESQTGLTAEWQTGADAFALSKQLQDDKVHLAIMYGFEFAWAVQKYPELKPLIITVGQTPIYRAYLVVAKNAKIASCADLKGKALAIPLFSREYCHLFLERRCCEGAKTPRAFYSRVSTPADVVEALNDVLDGSVQAAVVDKAALEEFRRYDADKLAGLRILLESESFPAGVIAYHAGADEKMLKRFREGMIAANATLKGRQLLGLCRLAGFAAVPADFDAQLKASAKAYPPPSE
jgi:ABC-type phosphate/phosphonate transport system substrate-binding protein